MLNNNAKKEEKKFPADKKIDETQAPAPATSGKKIEVDEAEYQKTVKELAEYKERCVRLYAEFENARKRYDREKVEFVKYANEGLISEFLNILDDLERAVNAAATKHEDYDAFLKGVELVMGRIHDLLKKNNIRAIEAVGKKFDPHCHEVLLQMPSAEHEDGTILEEMQRGYWLGDRVVRTAKVKVAVKPPEAKPGGDIQK